MNNKINEIDKNFNLIRKSLIESDDADIANRFNSTIETFIAALDIRRKHGNIKDFDKKEEQRNNKETQRKDSTDKCFQTKKTRDNNKQYNDNTF